MPKFPALADYPVYQGDIVEELCLLDKLVPTTASNKPAVRLDEVSLGSAKAGGARGWLPLILRAGTR